MSIRPPRVGQVVAFPYPKRFSLNGTSCALLDRPTRGFFPKSFLEDLRDSSVFEAHIAVGIPENDVLPTFSYSDFHDLSSTNKVCWRSINTLIYDKYKKRAAAGDAIATIFVKSLNDNRANLLGKKSVLVVPGFWQNFMNMGEAMKLARSILAASKFKVFVMATGHRASTPLNAREINPHIMGEALGPQVYARYFCSTPVCLGEIVNGDEVNFCLDRNVTSFFCLGVRSSWGSSLVADPAPNMLHSFELFSCHLPLRCCCPSRG